MTGNCDICKKLIWNYKDSIFVNVEQSDVFSMKKELCNSCWIKVWKMLDPELFRN